MCWHLTPRDTLASSLNFDSIACHRVDLCLLSGNSAFGCLVVSILVSKLLVPTPCSAIL